MAEKNQRLEIVTPERMILDEDVRFVVVPGEEGELGFLPDHAPLVSSLKTGVLRLQKDSETSSIAIHGGFVEVRGSRVTVLASIAEKANEIDLSRAQDAKQRAQQRLEQKASEVDIDRAQTALKRALTREKAAEQ
ncbi:MAG: F0F1 ATP synthase subunit epsilon [Clostridiales bacterium]|nr:F0F1 ATP synthase subunit epsilon [Clostridiales bacterium]MCF8022558.1 F0F1 ATP synthase subunit epsilon [Clostridiales bacterium]